MQARDTAELTGSFLQLPTVDTNKNGSGADFYSLLPAIYF
jgi:hypothetical protein